MRLNITQQSCIIFLTATLVCAFLFVLQNSPSRGSIFLYVNSIVFAFQTFFTGLLIFIVIWKLKQERLEFLFIVAISYFLGEVAIILGICILDS